MTFKELRQQSGMNLTQFSQYFNIPYRTIQNWELGLRQCPEYLLDLMKYKLDRESKKQQIIQAYIDVVESFKDADTQCIYERSVHITEDLKELEQDCAKWIYEFKALLDIENPTYHTRCSKCGVELMCLDSVKEHLTSCPECGAKMDK